MNVSFTRPHVLPAPIESHPQASADMSPAAPWPSALAGFLEIDLPPPRPPS